MLIHLNEEQEMMRRTIRKIMEDQVAPRAEEIDRKAEFPMDVKELFAENGIFGLVVPPEYGGVDGKLLTLCVSIEEVSRICGSSSMVLGNQSLGAAPIVLWGTEEQKQKYLPGIAEGTIMASFALTEPNAGSDVANLSTRAQEDGDNYIITGTKNFITHADIANVYSVFAKVKVDGKDKITCFLVDRETDGINIGKKEDKMGLRGSSTCEMSFEEVKVPKTCMLGGIGDGFKIALDSLDKGRTMTGAMALGIAQGAMEVALEYTQNRVQFGEPIFEKQAIQFILADMETKIQAARALIHKSAQKYDEGASDLVKFSAMSKLFATDIVMEVTTNAVQVMGGYGYCREYPVERMMRDAKIFAIFEGTNQIQRLVIARQLKNS